MDHYEYNPECLGCQAKARNKKHDKGSFQRDDPDYQRVVTMDQVTMTDLDETLGIGGFKYALVISKIYLVIPSIIKFSSSQCMGL